MDYIIKKIGGIDCIFIPMNRAHSVTTRVWIKAGSHYETNNEWGISHFLEHISLNGGEKWDTKMELLNFVRNLGGEIHGSTGRYFTKYYLNTPYEYLKDHLGILGDILVDTSCSDEVIEKERKVVIQEINTERTDNYKQTYLQGLRFFMGDCSYSREIYGAKESVMSFKREDILDYKKALYTRDNMVILIAGRICDKKELENLIGEIFGKLPENKTRTLPLFERKFPDKHKIFMEKGINGVGVAIFIRGFSRSSRKSVFCDVLANVMRMKLIQSIREKFGLSYGISARYTSFLNHGFFVVEIQFRIEDLFIGLDKIDEVFDDMLINGIDESELSSIKNSMKGDMLINYETPYSIADFVASNYIILDKVVFPEDKAKEFEKVTMRDMEEVLPLLKKENRYTFYIK